MGHKKEQQTPSKLLQERAVEASKVKYLKDNLVGNHVKHYLKEYINMLIEKQRDRLEDAIGESVFKSQGALKILRQIKKDIDL